MTGTWQIVSEPPRVHFLALKAEDSSEDFTGGGLGCAGAASGSSEGEDGEWNEETQPWMGRRAAKCHGQEYAV